MPRNLSDDVLDRAATGSIQGQSPVINANVQHLMSGGRVTDIYGATPFDDNVFLDWIGAPGGLADVSQIKKALGTSFINMTTGVIATLIDEVVDQIEDDEPTKVDMLRDFRDNGVDLQSLTEFATSFVIDTSPIPIMPTEMRNFVSDAIEKTGAAEVLRETSNGIKNWNQEFLARNDLALGPDEEPTLLYNIVSGGTSLLASLGLLLLTKNPQLAATVLGTVQQTQAYEAYMAAGEEADKALAMSLVEAAVVGWLEMVGQGVWLNNVIGRGSSPLRGALRGGAVNFQEEFSQAGAEEFFRKIGGINDNTMMESFGSMLGQGIVGGLSGSPLGAVTGPMEMKGIRKAVDGGDYREALAETVAGRLIDDTSAELEFRVDAMSGEAKTEAGKQLSGVFNQIIDIAKAFNDGVDIQEVYKTKEQQEAFVADIIDRAGKSRTRKLAQEKAGRLRVLREKEANILEKIGAESDAAEVFIESLADKFDAETSAADKVESLRELLDTTAGDPDFVADADTIFDAIVNQEIDVAEYEALIEELRNDQDFETILEGSSRYINIQKRANKLNKELEQVRSEMTSLKESDANIADIIGDEYIKIRGDVVEDIRQNQAVKSLVDGIRLGKKLSSDQISSVQSALTDGIKKLEGTGVSDKAIKSLLRRVAATKSPVRLQYIVNNLPTMLQSDIVRQSKQQSIKNTKAIIKKFSSKRKNSKAYSTLDAQVSDAVDTMRHAEKNLSKGVGRRAEGESLDEFQTRKRDVMRNRFAAYVSKIMNDPMPDNAKSVAIQYISSLVEEPSFVEQVEIEQMVKGLVGIGRDIRSEKMAQREAEIFDATKDVVDKNQSKTKFNPDKLATKIKEAFSQPGNILVKSYNTLLDQMNIRDNKVLGQLEDLNILNAENRTRNDDELLQMIKDTVGAKYFTNEYLKGKVFSRDEIKIGKGRMVEFLNTLDEATDLDTAKKNVLRYIQHRSGDKGFGSAASKVLRDNVRGAESISDLTSIVGRMPQDLRDSYAIDWTHGELMYWYMLLQNDDMRESIMAPWGDMAMSEELVAEIESSITENDKKLVDVLSKKYEEMYEKINDVYRRINGTNLQRVENYTPVSREAANGSDLPIDPVNDFAHYLSPSLTKLRNNNAIRIKDQDAVDVYLKHVRNAQHYIDYAEWFEKATRVIAGASRDIIDTHGMSAYQALLGHIQLMEKVQNIEMNTQFAPLKYFRKTFMLSTLGANPQIGVKQLTSIFAMADNMPTTDFVGYVNEFFENPAENIRLLREHITWRNRGDRFNKELETILNDHKMRVGGKFSFQDAMMLPVRIGDAIPVYLGGYAQYKHALNNGKSKSEALQIAAKKVEGSQQTSLEANLSLMQKRNDDISKTVTMFTSSPLALLNMELQAMYQYKSGNITGDQMMRKMAIYHVIIPAFFTWVASAFDADEEEYIKSMLIGTTGSAPIVGAPLDIAATFGANTIASALGLENELPYFDSAAAANPIADAAMGLFTIKKKIEDAITDVTSGDPVTMAEGVASVAEAIDFVSTIPSENIAESTAGLLMMLSDEEDSVDGLLQFWGWSPYVIEQDED